MKNNIMKRTIAILLSIITIISATAILTVSSSAAEVKGTSISTQVSPNESATELIEKGLISELIGKIPFIGDFGKIALDPFLCDMFHITSLADISNKLDEISGKIDKLSTQMDKNTQEILSKLYTSENLKKFNEDATDMKNMTTSLYTNLSTITGSKKDDLEKDIKTASLIDFSSKTQADYPIVAKRLATYIKGEQVSLTTPESIYNVAYKATCKDALIGGEVALKNANYVNSINMIVGNAYKMMITVLNSKLYVADHIDEIAEKYGTGSMFYRIAEECNFNRDYYEKLLKDGTESNGEGYVKEYSTLFDTNNENSIVSKYNKMVKDNWFSFITKTDYSATATVEFLKVKSELGSFKIDDLPFRRDAGKYECEGMLNNVTNAAKSKAYSALSKDKLENFYRFVLTSEIFRKDGAKDTPISLLEGLKNYGFTFSGDASDAKRPIFITNAWNVYENIDTSMERSWKGRGYYSGFGANDKGTTPAGKEINYFNFREYRGCDPVESGDASNLTILFLEKA